MPAGTSALPAAAAISLVLAGASTLVVLIDIIVGHRQKMWIMDVVWPITALWAGPLGLLAYVLVGRRSARQAGMSQGMSHGSKPFWQSVGIGALHCGAGCSLADLAVEWTVLLVPVSLFGSHVFGTWFVDFIVAFVLGIAFQYFAIAPMRHLTFRQGIAAALKADTLSLSAWQLGMYGWMALVLFVFYSPAALPKTRPVFWFMMQVAMLAGFCTSYPVNWWLLRRGIKEVM